MTEVPAVAAIDVGSNAIRLSIVEVTSAGVEYNALHHRYNLRLGGDVFATGEVSQDTITALRDVFLDIATRLSTHRVHAYRAVATSAMREARNSNAVIEAIKHDTGISLEVITGEEESRLARDALGHAVGGMPPQTLMFDLGGGSLEVAQALSASPGQSLPFGTVRLLQKYPLLAHAIPEEALRAVSFAILNELRACLGEFEPSAGVAIGTGGNFDVLARLLPHHRGSLPSIDTTRLDDFAGTISRMPTEQRGECYSLRPDRADLLLPAVLVTSALTQIFHLETLIVPGTGLRQAILRELQLKA